MAGESYTFDKQSVDAIGETVRRVKRIPNTDDVGSIGPEHMVPYQFQRFQLIDTWTGGTTGQEADAYRMYWSGSGFTADTEVTYKIYSDFVETWDTQYNESSSTDYHMVVIAYHRHDVDRWEVIQMSQNLVRNCKVIADWEEPGVGKIYPTVSVKILDDGLVDVLDPAFDAIIPTAWDKLAHNRPAPELFEDDRCQVTIDIWGKKTVSSPLPFSYLGQVIDWVGSVDDIPPGWVLATGAGLPVDKKVGTTNSPDLRGRFTMGVDPFDSAGDGSEETVGSDGGYRLHGDIVNNHADHDDHRHFDDLGDNTRLNVSYITGWDAGGSGATLSYNQTTALDAVGATGSTREVSGTDILNHTGFAVAGETGTDNRPQYYALAKLYRYK